MGIGKQSTPDTLPISSRTTGASGTNRCRTSRSRGSCSAISWRRGRSPPTLRLGLRIGLENSRPRFDQSRRGGTGRRGPRLAPRNRGSERSRKSSARSAWSAVFIVGLLQPTQHFGIDLLRRPESNLDLHRLWDSRRLQASARLSPLEPKAEIDAVLRRRSRPSARGAKAGRSEEHTSELQSRPHLVCRLLLEKKKLKQTATISVYACA